MAQFHQLSIQVYKETKDCSVITFNVPKKLQETFKYRQGQHLTLRAFIDGEDVRRSYSLCSSPVDNEWQVAVKQIPGGAFSTYANTVLKTGGVLDVMPPNGKFGVATDTKKAKNYVVFAAGSGITPCLLYTSPSPRDLSTSRMPSSA